MNIDEIRELVKLMTDNELAELDVSDGEVRVHMKKGLGEMPMITSIPAPPPPSAVEAEEPVEQPAEELVEIRSPMVGTFYTASSPDSEPYVRAGSSVSEDDVVCIIEAMKVMNEIKADCEGTVAEICVKNAQPVEFGQVLFRVKPA